MKTVVAVILLLLPFNAFAKNDIECSEGAIIKGETTPEVREAWCEISIKEGKTVLDGPYRAWYRNGILGTAGQYDKGNAVGTWYGWYDSGEKQGEEVFGDGKKESSKYWDKKGKPLRSLDHANPPKMEVNKRP